MIMHVYVSPPKYLIIPLPSIYLSWNDFPQAVLNRHFIQMIQMQ